MLFGLIVVVAVLIHNAGTKGSTLVFAAALTLGSACGELVTVLFVFREMAIQETMPWAIVLVIQLLLIVVSAVLTFIAIQRVTGALGSQEEVSVIP